jgi:hypothetical protein
MPSIQQDGALAQGVKLKLLPRGNRKQIPEASKTRSRDFKSRHNGNMPAVAVHLLLRL